MTSHLQYRVDRYRLHQDDDPRQVSVHANIDDALAAAASAMALESEDSLSMRFLVY